MTIIIVIIISLITGMIWACIRTASKADDDNKLVTFKCEQCVYKQKCINAGCNINDCRQGLQEQEDNTNEIHGVKKQNSEIYNSNYTKGNR